jgi:putative hydrolase of the HAD superfamily
MNEGELPTFLTMDVATRPRLVLDAGGVLFGESFRPFLRELATENGRDADEMIGFYNSELRRPLWTGSHSEEDFWLRIADWLGVEPQTETWRQRMLEAIDLPLPVAASLERWADVAELWILSNHRHEWLAPLLAEAGFTPHFTRILVSSELGEMKPDPAIFERVVAGRPVRVLFVDDKQENLDAGAAFGIEAQLAEAGGAWQDEVDDWLERAA